MRKDQQPYTAHAGPPPDFELPPDNRPRWFKYVFAFLAVGIVAALFLQNLGTRQKTLAGAIPERPAAALASFPQILGARIADAEHRAAGEYSHESITALAELARLYHANGFPAQASQIYPALIRLDPKNPRWPFLQAAILADLGRPGEAIPLLQSACALAPDRTTLRLRLADLLLETGRPAEAAALYRAVMVDDPGSLSAILGLARIDIASQSWISARLRLILATELHPDFTDPWNLLATVHEKLNQPGDAQKNRDRAKNTRAFHPPDDEWLGLLADDCYDAAQVRAAAVRAQSAGDTLRAIALLNHALDFAPDDAATHRQLGELHAALGDAAQARARLEHATRLAPSDAAAWTSLIALSNATGDTATAIDDAVLALAHCPQSAAVRREYARALKAAGNLDAALRQFQETRRLRPEESQNEGIEIALIHFRQNRIDDGAAELREVLKTDPGQPVALTLMTRLAIVQNKAGEAAQWLALATAEPRVPRADVDRLNALYKKQFGP